MIEDRAARLMEALDDVRQLVRSQAVRADRRSALSDDVVDWLIQNRFFRLWIPHGCDGFELSLSDALEIYEAAARIDGSFGWAVMIGAGGGVFAAYLEAETAREIYGPPEAVIAGSGAPMGRAERVAGGYRVNGRWRYASGTPYATTFTANCIITKGGQPAVTATGEPLVRAMAFPRSEVEIIETWDATGMRATASHDFVVEDALVPERRSFSVFADAPRVSGPLYRVPFQVLSELPLTAVALGITRHALDAFQEVAAVKRPFGGEGVLADDPTTRSVFARAHAAWQLTRSGTRCVAERAWSAAVEGRAPSAEELAEITAVCAHGVGITREAASELIGMAGMAGVDHGSELARAGRDLSTLAAHFAVSARQLMAAGETLLNSPRDG